MERDSFIELAGEADLPDIARIHIASWQDAYRGVLPSEILASRSREGSLRGWQSTLKKFPGNLTVARAQDEAILGFCCAGPVVDEARSGPFGFESTDCMSSRSAVAAASGVVYCARPCCERRTEQ